MVHARPRRRRAPTGRASRQRRRARSSSRRRPGRLVTSTPRPGRTSTTYKFPAGFTKSGNVRLGSHPDDHLLELFGERPAFLVTDSTTAGVYDTVYVDLDDDYPLRRREAGDEGVAGVVSRHERRRLHRPLGRSPLLHLGRRRRSFRAAWTRSASRRVFAPGEMLAWTGDYDPAIGGHGTLTASNIVGQGVINGRAPTFSDVPGGTYPGAVIGGAPKAKLAPYGDIYFSFDFSTQFGYFLATRAAASTSRRTRTARRTSTTTAGMPPARRPTSSTTAAGRRPSSPPGTARPASARSRRPRPSAGINVGASTQFGGTGWDSIDRISQVAGRRRDGLVEPRLRRDRRPGRRRRRRRRVLGRRRDAQRRPRRPERVGHVGRHEPLGAGGGRRHRARSTSRTGRTSAPFRPASTHGEGHPEVVRRGPRLRRRHPGCRLGRRRRTRWRPRPARAHASRRTSGGSATTAGPSTRSSRTRSRPAAPTARRSRSTGPGRGRSPTGRCVRTDTRDVRLLERRPVEGERVQLQRSRLPRST